MFANAEAVERTIIDDDLRTTHTYRTHTKWQTIHVITVRHLQTDTASN